MDVSYTSAQDTEIQSSPHLQDLGFSPALSSPRGEGRGWHVCSETQHLPEASSGLIQTSTEEAVCSHHPTLSSAEILVAASDFIPDVIIPLCTHTPTTEPPGWRKEQGSREREYAGQEGD